MDSPLLAYPAVSMTSISDAVLALFATHAAFEDHRYSTDGMQNPERNYPGECGVGSSRLPCSTRGQMLLANLGYSVSLCTALEVPQHAVGVANAALGMGEGLPIKRCYSLNGC